MEEAQHDNHQDREAHNKSPFVEEQISAFRLDLLQIAKVSKLDKGS